MLPLSQYQPYSVASQDVSCVVITLRYFQLFLDPDSYSVKNGTKSTKDGLYNGIVYATRKVEVNEGRQSSWYKQHEENLYQKSVRSAYFCACTCQMSLLGPGRDPNVAEPVLRMRSTRGSVLPAKSDFCVRNVRVPSWRVSVVVGLESTALPVATRRRMISGLMH